MQQVMTTFSAQKSPVHPPPATLPEDAFLLERGRR
jgi:hypothetical protein